MRLIDADALLNELSGEIYTKEEILSVVDSDKHWMQGNNSAIKEVKRIIDKQQTVEAFPIVRCKDCEYYQSYIPMFENYGYCHHEGIDALAEFACIHGKAKEKEE